jgi:hypothetical protein
MPVLIGIDLMELHVPLVSTINVATSVCIFAGFISDFLKFTSTVLVPSPFMKLKYLELISELLKLCAVVEPDDLRKFKAGAPPTSLIVETTSNFI